MIVYPDFKKIINESRALMRKKYPQYQNSWINFGKKHWWMRRIEREVKEIFKSKSPEELKKECCDVINIAAMIYENADNFRYDKNEG